MNILSLRLCKEFGGTINAEDIKFKFVSCQETPRLHKTLNFLTGWIVINVCSYKFVNVRSLCIQSSGISTVCPGYVDTHSTRCFTFRLSMTLGNEYKVAQTATVSSDWIKMRSIVPAVQNEPTRSHRLRSWGSSISIVSDYILDNCCSILDSGKGFFPLPTVSRSALRSPPSCPMATGAKHGRGVTMAIHPILCRRQEWVGATLLLSIGACMAYRDSVTLLTVTRYFYSRLI
jgi:hypothetical protein